MSEKVGKTKSYIRHGIGAVRPYLYGNLQLPDFLTKVFGAEMVETTGNQSSGYHVEMRIADSILVVETGDNFDDVPRGSVYVYVEDADATYQRAMQNGATSIQEPEDKPYEERAGGFKDPSGNTWWFGTLTASK